MKLTGKAKEEFEKYFEKLRITPTLEDEKGNIYSGMLTLIGFYKLPPSMQWGMYVDFFNSLGVYPIMFNEAYIPAVNTLWQVFEHDPSTHDCWGNKSSACYGDNGEYNNTTAREAAIKKAVEVYNNRVNE